MLVRIGLAALAAVVCICGSSRVLTAGPIPAPPLPTDVRADKVPTFKADVMPILTASCVNCHNDKKAKAKVDVSSYDAVMKIVKANDADKSRLVQSATGKGAKIMPPKKGLPGDQVAVLKAWIAAGAKND
ncbi:repeat-containing protein : Uncharacterized protein OS=Fimbriimonas ginsengisoli Gsoil 348 GN=OP10G_1541 PE=4 SV=1: PSCyt1 [Gemmataceae bacterium]|nr:repeat-containing protein : Uncharacterized protein OS=Fimbriimonas ginsengisoli Gsoil 348 GN=OP10G_1541 PE=4 SV=1: PSCyt1 [Gemmataceae bacterium]VTT97185.1 repeat-containing protein : Uncharacterized protein OS=Fimbriimonas ginsengisoli Gsoil 348 GN=OP10G_1541 PE=4 SV=1: PSCyt1 [Gemmataceae bacterium]